MPRKTIGSKAKAKDEFDYEPLVDPGITMLKFGQGGTPHERLFKLSGDLRYLSWSAGWFSAKLGGKCQGRSLFFAVGFDQSHSYFYYCYVISL